MNDNHRLDGNIDVCDAPSNWISHIQGMTLAAPEPDWVLSDDGHWSASINDGVVHIYHLDNADPRRAMRWAAGVTDAIAGIGYVLSSESNTVVGFRDIRIAQRAARALLDDLLNGSHHFEGLNIRLGELVAS